MNFLWDNIFKAKPRDQDIHVALKENHLFQDLGPRELSFVEKIVHYRKYAPGELVFRQGELGVGMYIIMKGRVEIYIQDAQSRGDDTREIYVTQLLTGDFFGELSLVEDRGRRTASAVAREETALIGFFKPDLIEIVGRSPLTGVKIMTRLAEILGRRLKETTEKVSELRRALQELREPPLPESADGKQKPEFTS